MADAFEKEAGDEETISIGDYLKAVEEEYLEADLVLGGDEGKECTYSQGYMKRQAIFSCLTCTPDGNAGVCTACSLSCHEGHEVVELWTKRNFKCDCGNSKFGEFYCKLLASKDVENSENSYNHNFKGTYCTCDLPYPDPNVEEQVEMIQCCICEDWFHEEHLNLAPSDKIPRDVESEPVYEDLICHKCATVCSFLTSYPQTIFAKDQSNTSKDKAALVDNNNDGVIPLGESKSSLDMEAKTSSSVSGTAEKCILQGGLIEEDLPTTNKPMFLSKNWREVLCKCNKCVELYAQKKISYLLDKEDSIAEYEKMAKNKRNENIEKQEQNFLNNLGHVEKIELLSGIADMKNEIFSFLNSSDPSKAITAEDVHQVFENLAKKRKRN